MPAPALRRPFSPPSRAARELDRRERVVAGRLLVFGVVPAVLVVASLFVASTALEAARQSDRELRRSAAMVRSGAVLLTSLQAAESGQRGFLLTNREEYLDRYTAVLPNIPQQTAVLTELASPVQRPLVADLEQVAQAKLDELAHTIALRRDVGLPAALEVVNADEGRRLMTRFTEVLQALDQQERQAEASALAESRAARALARGGLAVGTGGALLLLAFLVRLAVQRRRADLARLVVEQQRSALVEELSRLATHDALTGLPNRRLVTARLDEVLAGGAAQQSIAVLFIDLDRFKQVNDQHGHLRGDDVLVESARRMRAELRPEDVLARVGGDEFVAVCEGLPSRAEAVALAERLRTAASAVIDGISLDASIGVAFHPGTAAPVPLPRDGSLPLSGATAERLLDAADIAMYEAKERGRGRVVEFAGEVAEAQRRRTQNVATLAAGFHQGELWVAYQPVVDLRSERVVGLEALVRWSRPGRGDVPPAEFIPTAEGSGLILAIGEFVLATACEQAARWNQLREARGEPALHIAVNVSARQLAQPGFLETVRRVLRTTGLPAHLLWLEITETALIDSLGESAAQLEALSRLGLRIALDDFGTGYSSLSYLRRFPIDIVKVDRSFVSGLGRSDEDGAIVGAVVGLAQALSLETVAEGIELPEQAEHLERLGCGHAQGYLYARPLAARDLERLLLAPSPPRREDVTGTLPR